MNKYKLKADIQVDGDSHNIVCAYCGRKEKIIMTKITLAFPDNWGITLDSTEHTARVMCDKCFNQYD